jgi:DNA ligase 4
MSTGQNWSFVHSLFCTPVDMSANSSLEFSLVCQLFENLSNSTSQHYSETTIKAWFQQHDATIDRKGPGGLALLSCLLPEKRPDRVYGLSQSRLEDIVAQSQCFGHSRLYELRRLQDRDGLDLASAIEQSLAVTDDPTIPVRPMMIQDINDTLDRVAASCAFSSPDHRGAARPGSIDSRTSLVRAFRRLYSVEAKWLVRLLLKDLRPAVMPVPLTLRLFHFLLPDLLRARNTLLDTLALLHSAAFHQMPANLSGESAKSSKEAVWPKLKPRAGTMVGLPVFEKARSIKHCCQLIGHRKVSVERKYDGEYCQIHIQRRRTGYDINIFSKSGRNSTLDRVRLHESIKKSLGLGSIEYKFHRQCILVGELLVWNVREQQIIPFHRIRQYVTREGRRLGCARDSPVSEEEHLMVMLFDLLLLDDIVCLHEPHDQRRRRLWATVRHVPGQVEIGERRKLDFRLESAPGRLAEQMAHAIAYGWEGLVLKDCRAPYLHYLDHWPHIKLKKDYIPGLGDSADLMIIGGRRDAQQAQALRMEELSWTTFYLACPVNKVAMQSANYKVTFRIVGFMERPCISIRDMRYLNNHSKLYQVPFKKCTLNMEIDIDQLQVAQPTELFTSPLVVEVVGAGFDRPPNTRYFTLRFPRVVKIHHDRRVEDVLDFVEYQQLADRSRAYATDEDDQVKEAWLTKLGHPRHGHRSMRETYSQDSISSDRSVATVTYSTVASHQVTNKNKRTLPEGNDTAMLPIKKKARLNIEPLILRANSNHGSQYDQRSSTV